MNKKRRQAIAQLVTEIEKFRAVSAAITEQVEAIRDEEQECFDNMPESLQSGRNGSTAEEAISQFEAPAESLEEIDSSIDMLIIALNSAAA